MSENGFTYISFGRPTRRPAMRAEKPSTNGHRVAPAATLVAK
jgi:hypothetical protein